MEMRDVRLSAVLLPGSYPVVITAIQHGGRPVIVNKYIRNIVCYT